MSETNSIRIYVHTVEYSEQDLRELAVRLQQSFPEYEISLQTSHAVYFSLHVIAPVAAAVGGYLAKKGADLAIEYCKEWLKRKPKATGITIYLYGPDGEVVKEVERKGTKDFVVRG